MRLVLCGLLSLSFVSCVAQSASQAKSAQVEAFLKNEMQERHIPGLQVAVVQQGHVVFAGAYGVADIEHSVPVTDQTLFSIASITKAFTGVAIMQLVEEGKVNLNAPVSQYLNGLPVAWQPVTIQQLLTHESGIPDVADQKSGKIVGDGRPETFLSNANTLPMEFVPGDRFSYNQTNYLLLGRIVEKVSGESFVQTVTQRQFKIARMRNTFFGGFSDIIKDRAQPYAFEHATANGAASDQLVNIFYESVPSLLAANGINTSATQLADWIIALQQRRLLSADSSLSTMWTPGVLNDGSHGGFGGPLNGYALGWPVMTRTTHRAIAPIGGNWAAFFIYPQDDLSVVILTNLQGSHPEAFVDEVAGFYVPDIRAAVGFSVPQAIKTIQAELEKQGFNHAVDIVNEPANREAKKRLREADVNAWGYRLAGQGSRERALEIFKLNVNLFPDSANTYDSLADAYEGLGNPPLAILNYRQSLRLDPNNHHAKERLSALELSAEKQKAK